MRDNFDCGPRGRLRLSMTDNVERTLGKYGFKHYDDLPDEVKDTLQLMCHAIIQFAYYLERSSDNTYIAGESLILTLVEDRSRSLDYYQLSDMRLGAETAGPHNDLQTIANEGEIMVLCRNRNDDSYWITSLLMEETPRCASLWPAACIDAKMFGRNE